MTPTQCPLRSCTSIAPLLADRSGTQNRVGTVGSLASNGIVTAGGNRDLAAGLKACDAATRMSRP